MPNTREKLIELIQKPIAIMPDRISTPHIQFTLPYAKELADHLIANGVTILTEPECEKINIKLPKEIVVHPYKPKWIPVTERLPEQDGKYLVFEQSSGRTNTSVLRFAKDARKVDRYDFKGRYKNAWYEYDSEWGHYTVDSVTHWMPLPEAPKGE